MKAFYQSIVLNLYLYFYWKWILYTLTPSDCDEWQVSDLQYSTNLKETVRFNSWWIAAYYKIKHGILYVHVC